MSALSPMGGSPMGAPGSASAGPGGPGGFPPSIQIGGPAGAGAPSGGADSPDAEQDLHDAIDALHQFMQDETDHVDKAAVAKCIAAIQAILGTRQKGAEAAFGITAAHKSMSRAY